MILLLLLMMLLELLKDFDYLALALLVDIVRLILYFQCISYRIHIHLYCVFGIVFKYCVYGIVFNNIGIVFNVSCIVSLVLYSMLVLYCVFGIVFNVCIVFNVSWSLTHSQPNCLSRGTGSSYRATPTQHLHGSFINSSILCLKQEQNQCQTACT